MATMKAVRIHRRGGPEVMILEEVERPTAGPGQVLIKVAVAGVNYADVGQRQGGYPNLAPLPLTLGYEVAGTVAQVGQGIGHLREGMRVVANVEGGYVDYALAQAMEVIPLPDNVEFTQAIVVPIQGLTAYLLLDPAARLQKGESVLVHVAAGGVGSLAVQIAKLLGAGTVVGTTRSQAKMELIRELGADSAVDITQENWPERVMEATHGRGVDIVLDAVGGRVGQQSLEVMAPFGRMVVFGAVSGQPTPLMGQHLVRKCLSVTGFNTPAQKPEHMGRAGRDLVRFLSEGPLRAIVGQTFPIDEAPEAHRALEEGRTTGKVVLTL